MEKNTQENENNKNNNQVQTQNVQNNNQKLQKPEIKPYYRFDDFGYDTDGKRRVYSGIKSLDYDLKGFEMGCLTIWTGFTNSGKTTVMTMLAKQTIKQGHRIFFFNGEQTKEDFKNNLYIQSVDKKDLIKVYSEDELGKEADVYDVFVRKDKAAELEKEYGAMIYVYNNENKRKIDKLLKVMDEMREKEKIKVFFLDNFMQIETNGFNVLQEQTEIMEKLRTFAVNKGVHIHLVAHPRKTLQFQVRLDLFDVAGSSNLINKAYNVVSIIRLDNLDQNKSDVKYILDKLYNEEGYRSGEVTTCLEVLKTKGNKTGFIGLKFDRETKTYCEAPKCMGEELEKQRKMLSLSNATTKNKNKEEQEENKEDDKKINEILSKMPEDSQVKIFDDDKEDLPF